MRQVLLHLLASELLEDVGVTWVEPDVITYPTIIMGDCVEGDMDRNFRIPEEMKKDGTPAV